MVAIPATGATTAFAGGGALDFDFSDVGIVPGDRGGGFDFGFY